MGKASNLGHNLGKVWPIVPGASFVDEHSLQDLEPRFRAWNWPHSEHLAKESDLFKLVLENPPETYGNDTMMSRDTKNWTDCVETTMQWLIKDKIQFVSIFLNEPGDTAEIYGPESEETREAVKVIDDKVGQLVDRLEHASSIPRP